MLKPAGYEYYKPDHTATFTGKRPLSDYYGGSRQRRTDRTSKEIEQDIKKCWCILENIQVKYK